ncbi:MAG: L,D-transpeptidase family protein [Bacteroidetes bacterium]|nr:L,D-transpeptidase family protein [Bacteroidota bacterium]
MRLRDLFLLLCFILTACSNPVKQQLEQLEENFQFDKSELITQTKTFFTDSNLFNSFTKGLRFKDTLLTFYSNRKFEPVWAIYMSNDSLASILETVLINTQLEGFKKEYYRTDSIIHLQKRMLKEKGNDFYLNMAKLELLVSDNMLSFHRDRVKGRTNPAKVFGNIYQLPEREYPDFDLFEVLDNEKYQEVLSKNSHSEESYIRLKELLTIYFKRAEEGEKWFSIDTAGIKKLEPGDTTDILPQIAKKLYLMGVISEKESQTADPFYYNKSFAPLVRRFQQSYGLYDDAIFGRKTFGLLNASLQDRIDQIAANMERIRWFELPEDKAYIAVNLPAFEATLHWNIKKENYDKELFQIEEEIPDSINTFRVCIGKAHPFDYDARYAKYVKEGKYWLKPPDHETPQIHSYISYFVINPTWTVPRSIITREMFYQMKNDKFYLEKNGYGVFYKGKEVRSDSINWSKYSPTNIPFDIVQEAGVDNALGKIKFIFPNPFHIYLHDTPQKSKFKWSERAVSHGCVRVEKPILLGEFLMRNVTKNNADDFRIWMGYEPLDSARKADYDPLDSLAVIKPIKKTTTIRLNQGMPVYFIYNTIWFDAEGKVQYRNDVYDKNKYILKAMNY